MPSVTQHLSTKYPIRVTIRTRSPVLSPNRAASLVCNQIGLFCEISLSHLAAPLRVWIRVGRRNVGSNTNSSPESRARTSSLRLSSSPLRASVPPCLRASHTHDSLCTPAPQIPASPTPPSSG